MAKAVVTVSLQLADEMSKQLKQVAGKLSKSVGPLSAVFGVLGKVVASVTAVVNTLANVVTAVISVFELFGRTVSSAVGFVVASVKTLANELKKLFILSDKQQKSDFLLANSLKLVGDEAVDTLPKLIAFSNKMQDLTNISDDVVNSMQSILLRFNVQGKMLQEATKLSLDYSVAMGIDAVAATRRFARVLADPSKGLDALRELSKLFTDEERAMIDTLVEANDLLGAQSLILEVVSKSFKGAASDAAKRFAGEIDNLNNRLEDFKQALFESALQKGLEPFVGGLTKTSAALVTATRLVGELGEPLEAIAQQIAGSLLPLFEDLDGAIVQAFAGVETILENWELALELMELEASVAFKRIANSLLDEMGIAIQAVVQALKDGFDGFELFKQLIDPGGELERLVTGKEAPKSTAERVQEAVREALTETPEDFDRRQELRQIAAEKLAANVAKNEAILAEPEADATPPAAPKQELIPTTPIDTGLDFGRFDDLGFDIGNKKRRPQEQGPTGFESAEEVFKRISGAAGQTTEDKMLEQAERQTKILEKIDKNIEKQPDREGFRDLQEGIMDATRNPSIFPDLGATAGGGMLS